MDGERVCCCFIVWGSQKGGDRPLWAKAMVCSSIVRWHLLFWQRSVGLKQEPVVGTRRRGNGVR